MIKHHCYNCRLYIILWNILVTSVYVRAYVYACKHASEGREKEARRIQARTHIDSLQ